MPPTPTEKYILGLAKKHFGFSTLSVENVDRLDFKSVAKWSVREALLEAYREGFFAGKIDKKYT